MPECPLTATETAEARIQAQVAENVRLKNMLESLTPGGSEFHNDPERCTEYALERRDSLREIAKSAVKEKLRLEKELTALQNVPLGDRGRAALVQDIVRFLECRHEDAAAEVRRVFG